MFRFTLFGVPVEIQPWFWVGTAIFGGGIGARTPAQILDVLIFMIVAAISVLVHEFGHALVGRRVGGGSASISLHAFGGLAFSQGGRFTRMGHFWRVAAGPGAGFSLFLLTALALIVAFGFQSGTNLIVYLTFHQFPDFLSPSAIAFAKAETRVEVVHQFLRINFWWSLINLAPVLPLDGGRITDLFVTPQRRVYQIGLVAGIAVAAFGWFGFRSTLMALMFGYFAYQNYQMMNQVRWR
ncbi:M50 family metallopeptidase [Luteolibacter sp. LG18]|uniref:M50 family metallopeptidase n=1 Tax=Luteolibacter sp. LG18 TaxID=2819286 RepID=UPI002B2CD4BB|nr:peptidase [Luteolibacter sp. LG18]